MTTQLKEKMTTIKFKEWEFIVDRELTKLTYGKVAIGGPESLRYAGKIVNLVCGFQTNLQWLKKNQNWL